MNMSLFECIFQEIQSMAKSGTRQNSKKKRDKRRLLKQQASPARYWEMLDVSGWFDTSIGYEQNILSRLLSPHKILPFPVYSESLPGEFYFSFYAHEHPEKEDETAAVRLVKDWYAILADMERDDPSATQESILAGLRDLAKKGCVTASCFLGYLYNDADHVRKNTAKAKQYLQFAADSNDPLACYILGTILPGDEGLAMLKKSAEYGCPCALQLLAYRICFEKLEVTGSELDSIAAWLAALASKGSWKSLEILFNMLWSASDDKTRGEYGPAMLSLLNMLAEGNVPLAVEYQGRAFMKGMLYPKNLEKAEDLLKRAWGLGAADAPTMYAACLMLHSKDTGLSVEARESKLKDAREILEGQCRRNNDDKLALGLLGSILVKSANDADFAKGIQCYQQNASHGDTAMAMQALRYILDWTNSPERHKAALKLLNSLVRRKDREAVFVRGRYCLLGGVLKKHDQEKGLKLLHQAAELGSQQACLLLGEIYLFGLFDVLQDIEKGLEMLQDGIDLGCDKCNVLYALLDMDEIHVWDEPPDSKVIANAYYRLCEHHTMGDDYMVITYSLVRTGADNAFKRYGMNDDFLSDSPASIGALANGLAKHCIMCMMTGNLGPLAYMADALGKIASTQYASLYAAAFAKEMPFIQGASCESISQYLTDFVWDAPESFESFRAEHGGRYCTLYGPV